MAIRAIENDEIEQWFINGGRDTIRSYTKNKAFIEDDLSFFKSLPLYYESENYIFVHAGLDPKNLIPESNGSNILLWIRDEWLSCDYNGKPVVFGHTPARTVTMDQKGRKLGIDTGAVYWGTLSCFELPSKIGYITSPEGLCPKSQKRKPF